MLTMVGGSGAKCTRCGTTTPTPILKLTLETRGALPPLMTVCRISVRCCCVRLTVGAVAALVVEEVPGAACCDDPLVAPEGEVVGWVELFWVPVPDWVAWPGWPLADGDGAPEVEPGALPLFDEVLGAVGWFEVAAGARLGALPWVVPGLAPGEPVDGDG